MATRPNRSGDCRGIWTGRPRGWEIIDQEDETMTSTNPALDVKSGIKITDIKSMQLRQMYGQSLIKIETNAGIYGVGEAGASGPMVRAHLKYLKPILIGADPLEIEKLFTQMVNLMHPYRPNIATISGIDIALWDLAGKILGRPVSKLLSGRYRDEVSMYINSGPSNLLDPESCRTWAEAVKSAPEGWHTLKVCFFGVVRDHYPDPENVQNRRCPMLTQRKIELVRRAFENCRVALGDDIDFIIHCHNELDLPSSISLAQAVAPYRPLCIEDPLPVDYSDSWSKLTEASPVRIETGEKLELEKEFLPFIVNRAVDMIQPDIVFAGGITGLRRIAELADLFYIPIMTHNVGSLVQNMATAHFGASTRNFVMSETCIGQRNHDVIYDMGVDKIEIRDGKLKVPDRPGLGIELNPHALRSYLDEGEEYWD